MAFVRRVVVCVGLLECDRRGLECTGWTWNDWLAPLYNVHVVELTCDLCGSLWSSVLSRVFVHRQPKSTRTVERFLYCLLHVACVLRASQYSHGCNDQALDDGSRLPGPAHRSIFYTGPADASVTSNPGRSGIFRALFSCGDDN